MPSAYTHIQFAKDLTAFMPRQDRERIRNMPMFWLGTQGPDILFFSHMSVMPGSLHPYGNLLHEENVRETFLWMKAYCKRSESLWSYYLGWITHYALDSHAHELIVSIAADEHQKTGFAQGSIHVRIESQLDAWIFARRSRPSDSEIFHAMKDADVQALSAMFQKLLKSIYHMDIPYRKILGAFHEFTLWNPLARPHAVGSHSLFGGEFLIASPHHMHDMIHHPEDAAQASNLSHRAYPLWYNPEKTISLSFDDAYQAGLYQAEDMISSGSLDSVTRNFMGKPLPAPLFCGG